MIVLIAIMISSLILLWTVGRIILWAVEVVGVVVGMVLRLLVEAVISTSFLVRRVVEWMRERRVEHRSRNTAGKVGKAGAVARTGTGRMVRIIDGGRVRGHATIR